MIFESLNLSVCYSSRKLNEPFSFDFEDSILQVNHREIVAVKLMG